MTFDPFGKPFSEIESQDLQALVNNSVAEGYSVEYKSTFPSTIKIARSIASFANTIGGWYIVGVESDPVSTEATAISGFRLSDFPDPLAKVRDAIRSNTQPTPIFLSRVFSISPQQSVVLVRIPDGQNTPFITADGRIYRRVADSSEPVPETDRYALDRLVDQGREIEDRFHSFCHDPRQFSQAEGGGWLGIFIDPKLSPRPVDAPDMLSADELRAMLAQSSSRTFASLPDAKPYLDGSIPFQSALLTNHSMILRQTSGPAAPHNSLEIELFGDGRLRLLIPLPTINILEPSQVQSIANSSVRSFLYKLADADDVHLLTFFDMRKLWQAVAVLVTFYQDWLRQHFTQPLPSRVAWSKLVLSDVWRHVPLVDSQSWLAHVNEFMLPTVKVDSITVPDPLALKRYLELSNDDPYWFPLAGSLAFAFGLPLELIPAAAFPDEENTSAG